MSKRDSKTGKFKKTYTPSPEVPDALTEELAKPQVEVEILPAVPQDSNMGRPPKEIDRAQFEAMCRLNPTLKDVAAFFKCSENLIVKRCHEWGYANFIAARDQNMVHTRLKLIRKAVKLAEDGNVAMLIFSLKNLCGWTDKHETNIKEISNEELVELGRKAIQRFEKKNENQD